MKKLDDYIATSDKIDLNDMIPAVATLADGLGGVYGLPWRSAAEVMYYNVEMFNEAGIMPAPSSDTADYFASGMAAMSWQGTWMTGTYVTNILAFKWDMAPMPKDQRQYNTLHTGFYTIAETCKQPDLAWKTIEYLMSDGQDIVMKAGALTALNSKNATGAWKMDADLNWEAYEVAMATGVFGYTCLPAGVTGNAVNLFQAAVLGQITPEEAVEQAMQYAAETIGY